MRLPIEFNFAAESVGKSSSEFRNRYLHSLGGPMKSVRVSKFGKILTSRPEGREAALQTLAADLRGESSIEIDFGDVLVMTPSWLGEFVTTLRKKIRDINFRTSTNASVVSSLDMVNATEKECLRRLLDEAQRREDSTLKTTAGHKLNFRIANYHRGSDPYLADVLIGINGGPGEKHSWEQLLQVFGDIDWDQVT